jgi:hypothetical protein
MKRTSGQKSATPRFTDSSRDASGQNWIRLYSLFRSHHSFSARGIVKQLFWPTGVAYDGKMFSATNDVDDKSTP